MLNSNVDFNLSVYLINCKDITMIKQKHVDGMLLATLLTTLFYSATYPYIHKEIVSVVSDSVIALNQIINCLSIIIW